MEVENVLFWVFFFLQLCPAEFFFFSYATFVRFVISVSDVKDIWKTEAKKKKKKKITYIPTKVCQTICADFGLLWQWEYLLASVMVIPLIHSNTSLAEQ